MTISLTDLTQRAIDVLMADDDIANFDAGKPTTFFMGVDNQNQPADNFFPVVVVYPDLARWGNSVEAFDHALVVWWGIINRETDRTTPNLIKYIGMAQCDDLGRKIYDRLCSDEFSESATIDMADYDLSPVSNFPIFSGLMTLQIETPNTLGGPFTMGI